MFEVPNDRIQEFYEFWRKAHCPRCNAVNWIYDSHSQRHYPDIRDGVKCHACTHLFWTGEKSEFLIRYGGELEEHSLDTILEEYFDYNEGKPNPD